MNSVFFQTDFQWIPCLLDVYHPMTIHLTLRQINVLLSKDAVSKVIKHLTFVSYCENFNRQLTDVASMGKDASKKLGVIGSLILAVALFAAVPLMYILAEAPEGMVLVSMAVVVVIAAILVYHSVQRLKEIEEGLEDDIDDY